ncbi:hypothetical protein BDN72DRAFT_124600 [Pluteus cervinus]|uniref:Uncharacterized protein n=1 Tax=Pluteus cervinus TaxID=181527 RepID=A0ACD3AM56_9AGAR|nr:hypothetical protein BDN72DRAFT_124600 [Pluteus cervinus]
MRIQDASPAISRLHPELLIVILKQVMKHNPDRDIALLWFTWVCRRWRCIILEAPLFWKRIGTTHPDFLRECLSRSRNLPITFVTSFDQEGYPDPIPTILQSLPRTEKLCLAGDALDAWSSSDIDLWKSPAPLLKTLEVSCFLFPERTFSGFAPLLQNLYLTRCAFDLEEFPTFPGLRSLSIVDARGGVPVFLVLDMFQTSPQLRSLHIERSMMDEAYGHNNRIHLPKLQYLSIQSEAFNSINELLTHITIPATAKINIHVNQLDDETVEDDDSIRIFDAMLRCRVPSEMTIRSLHIVASDEGHKYSIIESGQKKERASITIRFDGETELERLEDICSWLNLEDLEVLEIAEQTISLGSSLEFWIPFSGLQNLHTVKLCTSVAISFVAFMYEAHEPLWETWPEFGNSDEVNLDGHEELAIATLSFGCLRTVALEHLVESPSLDTVAALLVAVLSIRWLIGRRWTRLVVHGLVPSEEQNVTDLQCMVKKVTYYPVVQGEGDDDTSVATS